MLAAAGTDHVTLDWLLGRVGGRSFGLVLLLLSIFGLLPGVSAFAAVLLMIPAIQMLLARSGRSGSRTSACRRVAAETADPSASYPMHVGERRRGASVQRQLPRSLRAAEPDAPSIWRFHPTAGGLPGYPKNFLKLIACRQALAPMQSLPNRRFLSASVGRTSFRLIGPFAMHKWPRAVSRAGSSTGRPIGCVVAQRLVHFRNCQKRHCLHTAEHSGRPD
jgi:Exopolysaccharide synthesis, ExoD